jgi:sterol 3beta-glucosyltransferase
MNILLLAVGTRGDVQPFVALGKGLADVGHDVTVCTTSGFEPFVRQHGLRYAYLNNDLVELTTGDVGKEAIENFGGGPLGKARWIAEAARRFKPIFRRLLREEWEAAQGADLIIFHPSAVGGVHLAEALRVPGIMADPMPTWVPTGDFPNFTFPSLPLGAAYNRLTYRLLPALTRGMFGKVVTEWRRDTLGLPARPFFASDFQRTDGTLLPVFQAFSEHVVPRPADWPGNVVQTGYWFLDQASGWIPPAELVSFLADGSPPVFIGFGSMSGRNPARTARTVLEAVELTGQRSVIVTGWGGLEVENVPGNAFVLESAPYEWLLPRTTAVVHHGGAGTTAAGLRAGRASVVCPFVADQPFWGERVAALGVGPTPIPQRRLSPDRLARAIDAACTGDEMRARAARLGEKIRGEDGVATAVGWVGRILGMDGARTHSPGLSLPQ